MAPTKPEKSAAARVPKRPYAAGAGVKFDKHNAPPLKKTFAKGFTKPSAAPKKVDVASKKPNDGGDTGGADAEIAQNDRSVQKLRRLQRKSAKTPIFDLIQELKPLWEQLRIKRIEDKSRRKDIIASITTMVKGHLGDLIFKHDSSRIVQSIIKYSETSEKSDIGRQSVLTELQGQYVQLASSPYGRFVVLKALKYAPNAMWRSRIVQEFLQPKVITKYIRHKHAGLIVDTIYCLYANAKERQLMLEAFYGSEFLLSKNAVSPAEMKKDNVAKITLSSILERFPDRRSRIMSQFKESLLSIVGKDGAVGRNEIIHQVLLDYVQLLPLAELQSLICANTAPMHLLVTELASLVHTKPGSKLAMILLGACTAKERKIILKNCKEFALAIARDDAGWMVVCRAVDCVDDTVLLKSTIVSELVKSHDVIRESLTTSKSFRRLVVYMLVGQDRRYFSPDLIAALNVKSEFLAETSKKDAAVRRREVQVQLLPEIYAAMDTPTVLALFSDWSGCQLLLEMAHYGNEHEDIVPKESMMQLLRIIAGTLRADVSLITADAEEPVDAAAEDDNDSDDSDDELEVEMTETEVADPGEEISVDAENTDDAASIAAAAELPISSHYLKSKREEAAPKTVTVHPLLNPNVSRLFKKMTAQSPPLLSVFADALLDSDAVTNVFEHLRGAGSEDASRITCPLFFYLAYLECEEIGDLRKRAATTIQAAVTQTNFQARPDERVAVKFMAALEALQ